MRIDGSSGEALGGGVGGGGKADGRAGLSVGRGCVPQAGRAEERL